MCFVPKYVGAILYTGTSYEVNLFSAALCHGIHDIPVPLYCRGGVFLTKHAKQITYTTPLLSETSESQERGNHQDKTSNYVSS